MGIGGVLLLTGIIVLGQTVGLGLVIINHDSRPLAYPVQWDGQLEISSGQGPPAPGTGDCMPPLCQQPYADLQLRIEGAPKVGPGMHYVVWLGDEDSTDGLFMGALETQGEGYRLEVNRTGTDPRSYTELQVWLSSTPEAGDSQVLVGQQSLGPFEEGNQPETVELASESTYRVFNLGWRCCGSQGEEGLTLSVVQPGLGSGLVHCGWLLAETWGSQGLSKEFDRLVATKAPEEGISAAGCQSGDEPSWTFSREELEGIEQFVVTIEPNASAAREAPSGFALLEDRLSRRI